MTTAEQHTMDQAPAEGGQKVLLSVRQARRVFTMGEVDVVALRNATIDIYEGEFIVILGPSGSGKSTLLNLLGGMDRPTGGTVLYDDKKLSEYNDSQMTLYRRHEVGFIFQFYNLVPTLTAQENVEVATELARKPMDAMDALKLVSLSHRADHFPAQLSGGEQQRVAVARAFAGNPRLLLADEPTGALDVETSRDILRLLVRFNRDFKKTVIVITHNTAITGLADRVAHIRDGEIVSLHRNEHRIPVEEVDW